MKRLRAFSVAVLCLLFLPGAGWLPLVSAPAGGCSQATTTLAGMSLSGPNQAIYTTLICGLVTDGTWSGFDVLYILGTQDSTNALINIINPGTNNSTVTGALTFTANQGYSGWSSTKYLSSIASNGGTNFTQNSGSIGFWESSSGALGIMQASDGSSNLFATRPTTGGAMAIRIFDSLSLNFTDPGTYGLLVGNRSGSAARQLYFNGVSEASDARASLAPTSDINTLGKAGGPLATVKVALWFFGRSFTATEQTNIYNRFNTALTSLGSN